MFLHKFNVRVLNSTVNKSVDNFQRPKIIAKKLFPIVPLMGIPNLADINNFSCLFNKRAKKMEKKEAIVYAIYQAQGAPLSITQHHSHFDTYASCFTFV